MARIRKTTATSTKRAPEPAPKKRLGRPLGSKNRVTSAGKAKAAPVASTGHGVSKKTAAPVVPKLNKAELEHQVIKLERTIARLRKQNAELKLTAREDAETATPAAAPAAAHDKKPKRASAPKGRSPASKSPKYERDAPDVDGDDATSDN